MTPYFRNSGSYSRLETTQGIGGDLVVLMGHFWSSFIGNLAELRSDLLYVNKENRTGSMMPSRAIASLLEMLTGAIPIVTV